MTWFYNSHTGTMVNESPPSPGYFLYEIDLHTGQGWHAYATEQQVEQAVKANHWPGPYLNDQGNPSGGTGQLGSEVGGTAGAGLGSLTGVNAIGDFFSRLTQANTWIRVGEFLAGAMLLYVGAKALTAPEGQQIARRTAKDTTRSFTQKLAKTTAPGRAAAAAKKAA